MLCAAGTRAGESCNARPYSAVSLPANRAQSERRTQTILPKTHRGRAVPPTGPPPSATCRKNRSSAVPIQPGSHPRDRESIARGARRKPLHKWFRSWFPPRGSVRKRAPARVRPHRRATSPRSCEGRQRGGAAQGRFQNIGRVVLCTRAGESPPQAAIRRGWPPI